MAQRRVAGEPLQELEQRRVARARVERRLGADDLAHDRQVRREHRQARRHEVEQLDRHAALDEVALAGDERHHAHVVPAQRRRELVGAHGLANVHAPREAEARGAAHEPAPAALGRAREHRQLPGHARPRQRAQELLDALPRRERAQVDQPERTAARRRVGRRGRDRDRRRVRDHADARAVDAPVLDVLGRDLARRGDEGGPVQQGVLQAAQLLAQAGERRDAREVVRRLDAHEPVDLVDERLAGRRGQPLPGRAHVVDVGRVLLEHAPHALVEGERPAQPVGLRDREREVPEAGRRRVAEGHERDLVPRGEEGRVREDVRAGPLGRGHAVEAGQEHARHQPTSAAARAAARSASAWSSARFSARKSSQRWHTAVRARAMPWRKAT